MYYEESHLITCIKKIKPYRKIHLEPIRTGKFNTSFYVYADDEKLVLRIAPPPDTVLLFYERNMMKQEPELHKILLSRTTLPVPRILYYDFSKTIFPQDFLIMERLPGRPLSELNYKNADHLYKQLGQYLAQVHNITSDSYGYLGPHKPMSPQKTWHEAFYIMWHKLIEDVAGVGYYTTNETKTLSSLFERFSHVFNKPTKACLLHMDIWSQNILTDGKKITGILDWDRALWGDPEIEFAVLDYCGISTNSFWEGYATPRDTSTEAQIRRLFYLLYEVQKYIVIRHGRNRDPHAALQYKQHVFNTVDVLQSKYG